MAESDFRKRVGGSSHCRDEDTEGQSGAMTCLGAHSAGSGAGPRLLLHPVLFTRPGFQGREKKGMRAVGTLAQCLFLL